MAITNFPYGASSFGAPMLPWGLPFHTKTRYLFVDGTYGLNSRDGRSPDSAVKTIARATSLMTDNYGDVAVIMPGSYAERIVPTKSHCKYVGATPWNPGLTQIVGDGTDGPTVNVASAAIEGFGLVNIEVDVPSGIAQPAIMLETDDATSGAAAGASGMRGWLSNVQVRSNITRRDPTYGLYLKGTTLCQFGPMFFSGCRIGIGFGGSASNNPADLEFLGKIIFGNNLTADIATIGVAAGPTNPTPGDRVIADIYFDQLVFLSGSVTNYMNMGSAVAARCLVGSIKSARDIADGTLTLLPVGWTIYEDDGRIIGA